MRIVKCLICGMIINDKNYKVNSNAMREKNNENKVLSCPFCGAKYKYLKDFNKDVYNVKREELDKKTIKVLENAVKLEVFNSDFYREASKLVENEKIKHMFMDLANVELVHAKVHQRLVGMETIPKLKQLEYDKYKGEDGEKDLVELARKREIHAVKYYKKYSQEVNNEIVKEVFNALSEVEKDHVIIFSGKNKAYVR